MSVHTLCGYILIQTESQSVQGVNSYDILFAGMSNVWKRYLFANPVTYDAVDVNKIVAIKPHPYTHMQVTTQ